MAFSGELTSSTFRVCIAASIATMLVRLRGELILAPAGRVLETDRG